MKRLYKILILMIAGFTVTFGQVENSQHENPFYKQPAFFYDILSFKASETGFTRADIFIQVPFSQIQFIREGAKYKAGYTLTVSIYESDDKINLIQQKTWRENVELADFKETNSRTNFNLSLRSFELKPGEYYINIILEDRETGNQSKGESEIALKGFSEEYAISDMIIISELKVDNGKTKIIPNVSRNVAGKNNQLSLFYEIYSDSTLTADIRYVIKDEEDDLFKEVSVKEDIKKGKNQIFFKIDSLALPVGEYKLFVELKASNGEYEAQAGKTFESRWFGVPQNEESLEKAAEQMIYIASGSEIDHILDPDSYDAMLERYLNYWDAKDPSPSTAENEVFIEYYRRVYYANEHFSNLMDGWRTDMGMVYIVLGPPDNVERHPFEYDSKPYEIWYYYQLNRRYVFLDDTGFGDYRLITPFYGEEYRR